MRSIVYVGAAVVSLVLCVGSSGAETVTIKSTKGIEDTYLRGGDSESTAPLNNGGAGYMLVGTVSSGQIAHSLIRATDFSKVSGKKVSSAILRIYRMNWENQKSPVKVDLYEVSPANSGWVEGNSDTKVEAGASCWRYMRQNTVRWAGGQNGCGVAGKDYNETLLGGATISLGRSQWIEFTLAPELVQKWIDSPDQNAGLLLIPEEETPGAVAYFYATEDSHGYGPELIVNVE